jgi:glycosyltransferase involved in cell wall biosynthesis
MKAIPGTDTVTIGVPVYRGELFIEETLRSIQMQTHQDIEVIISLDGPQPAVEELCRPFLKDPRFRLSIRPNRLGWVGNINWLMSQVETPYWCYQQQDDLLDPRYIEVLIDYARQTPQAAVVYGDLLTFGTRNRKYAEPSVTGSAAARQFTLLGKKSGWLPFRGLTRVEALRYAGEIRPNEAKNFGADVTWMAAVARWGELRRVPGELYRKRFHAENETNKWLTYSDEKFARVYMVHCADMLEQAMLVQATTQERRLLWLAAIGRLFARRTASRYLRLASWSSAEYVSLLDAFVEHVRLAKGIDIPGLLEANWKDIQLWTRRFYYLPSEGNRRKLSGRGRGVRLSNLWRVHAPWNTLGLYAKRKSLAHSNLARAYARTERRWLGRVR